ncbi:hypothetical protein H2198_000652 [Neophaeococcomyces mojaviensis]|uniref:Uncharacterized protein n=1 Tax=Neophaeococcomyces mojaviensis TaxID=3383035 RepID=A0ACC3AIX2_9EURO|nr:hypothetical protein H2198_000652 [Knufia sp. JES_112]
MSTGTSGSNENISSSKIQSLDSDQRTGVPHDQSSRGVVGTDRSIDQARIDPLGDKGVGQHTDPHADSQGVVGRDETIASAKIDPLGDKSGVATRKKSRSRRRAD